MERMSAGRGESVKNLLRGLRQGAVNGIKPRSIRNAEYPEYSAIFQSVYLESPITEQKVNIRGTITGGYNTSPLKRITQKDNKLISNKTRTMYIYYLPIQSQVWSSVSHIITTNK